MTAISNLQDFVDFVMAEEDFPDFDKVELSGWPRLDVKIYGDRYDGTLTPDVAKSLYDFYMELQRAYAYVKYGAPNLQRLTADDKKLFSSVEFRIENGCINLLGDYAEQTKSILTGLKELTAGMESRDKKHVVIFVALAIAGGITAYVLIDRYFDAKVQIAKADQQRQQTEVLIDGQKHALDAVVTASAQSVGRMEQDKRVRVSGASDQLEDAYQGIIRSAPDADRIDFSGAAFDQSDVEEIISRPSVDTYSEVKEGEFIIDDIRKAKFPKISIRISSIDTDEQYTVGFEHGMISKESYDRIFDAAKNNETVNITYNAIIRSDGVLHKATLINVQQGRYFSSLRNDLVADMYDDDIDKEG